MKKTFVLAEKPSVGKNLARILDCSKKGNGYYEGSRYVVSWALGHLVTLADPDAYDQKYASWRIEDLPMLPERVKLEIIKDTGRQYGVVREQMLRQDVQEIVIATDAGREGELVARWIIEKAQVRKPMKRLWISSVTDKAIREGFNSLKESKAYDNLYASAAARAEADWLVGLNATRALTCKYNVPLSCGRVQTPTLAMIAAREEEIRSFQPQTYYGITAVSEKMKLVWQDKKNRQTRIFDEESCNRIKQNLTGLGGKVENVHKVLKKSPAPRLYDLTELQREANRFFGFSPKDTLSTVQSLYEIHKIVTYPRTDSRYLSSDLLDTLKERVKACGSGPYAKAALKILKSPILPNKNFIDNAKVTDHHALIPTEQAARLTDLNDREKRIYDLIVKRFLAVLYPSFVYEQTTVEVLIGQELFLAKGKIVIDSGWKQVYEGSPVQDEEEVDGGQSGDSGGQDDDVQEQILPSLNKGDSLKILALNKTQGRTRPPAPFNEGTLLSAMENPGKFMAGENKNLIKTLDEAGGLGTVATRADIIEKLYANFVIEKKGRDLFITAKGRQLLQLVPQELRSPSLTAKWEQKLSLISKGGIKKDAFLTEIRTYTREVVKEIKNNQGSFRHDNLTRNKCPECGKFLLEVNGKKGKMLVCQDRNCGYRLGIARPTNARCPNCHKKLEMRGEGEGQLFACACGYREKLGDFKARQEKEGAKVNKKEIENYLRQQNYTKNEPVNTALADALAKLKKQE